MGRSLMPCHAISHTTLRAPIVPSFEKKYGSLLRIASFCINVPNEIIPARITPPTRSRTANSRANFIFLSKNSHAIKIIKIPPNIDTSTPYEYEKRIVSTMSPSPIPYKILCQSPLDFTRRKDPRKTLNNKYAAIKLEFPMVEPAWVLNEIILTPTRSRRNIAATKDDAIIEALKKPFQSLNVLNVEVRTKKNITR